MKSIKFERSWLVWLSLLSFAAIGLLYKHLHYRVSGTSMDPTLRDGQRIFINPLDRDPTRGEIYVLKAESRVVVKRLVAVAGDWVEIRNGVLWLNNQAQNEPFIAEVDPYDNFSLVRVPEGHVFVLGDNRLFTADSRHYGSIPEGDLIGKII